MTLRAFHQLLTGSLGFIVLVVLLAVAGCDQAGNNRPRGDDPATPRSNIRIDQNGTRVDVEPRSEKKPAVDVRVKPEGGVEVDVDRDKIREKIDERREERKP